MWTDGHNYVSFPISVVNILFHRLSYDLVTLDVDRDVSTANC